MSQRLAPAVILLVVGGALYIAGGLAVALLVASGRISAYQMFGRQAVEVTVLTVVTGFISGVAIIICAFAVNTGIKSYVRAGSIIAIIISLWLFGGSFGGLFVGLILVIVGSVLALIGKPKEVST